MKQKKNATEKKSILASSVLERIQDECIVPASKWKFRCVEYGVWVLWALTVALGAISVAVMFFVGDHARFALYEATHDTQLSFFVEVLPYIWIVVFGIMLLLAYVNLRHTKRGYRYPIYQVVLSSLVFSLAGGFVLNIFGVGALIDTQFGKNMPMYTSMEKTEARLWQQPGEGRLLGTFMGMDESDTLYMFTDRSGQQWNIETLELRDQDKQLLSSGRLVRVLGTTTDSETHRFYACGIFPWLYGKGISTEHMREDRKVFVARMYENMETYERLRSLEQETYGDTVDRPFVEGKCGELATMKRMRF